MSQRSWQAAPRDNHKGHAGHQCSPCLFRTVHMALIDANTLCISNPPVGCTLQVQPRLFTSSLHCAVVGLGSFFFVTRRILGFMLFITTQRNSSGSTWILCQYGTYNRAQMREKKRYKERRNDHILQAHWMTSVCRNTVSTQKEGG